HRHISFEMISFFEIFVPPLRAYCPLIAFIIICADNCEDMPLFLLSSIPAETPFPQANASSAGKHTSKTTNLFRHVQNNRPFYGPFL
ncbi:MAG: hypothetical protein ACQEQV_04670, partial [Fibrobacterota bacterium]